VGWFDDGQGPVVNAFANRSAERGPVVVADGCCWKTDKQQTRADAEAEARVVLESRNRGVEVPPGAARPARTMEDPFGRVWGCDRARLNNGRARLNGVERTITHTHSAHRVQGRAASRGPCTTPHFRRFQPLSSLQFFLAGLSNNGLCHSGCIDEHHCSSHPKHHSAGSL